MTSRQSQIGFSKLAPSLVARDLRKVIGKKTIVDGISFELFPGEVFGFLGPNGAGKTTTIRMLVGLIKPTKGSVTICGHDLVGEFEEAMRCVGCIVETPACSARPAPTSSGSPRK